MKSIEEEAKQYAQSAISCIEGNNISFTKGEFYILIKKIALQLLRYQKQVDVEKACDWLESNSINYVGKTGIMNFRKLYFDFKKIMEE